MTKKLFPHRIYGIANTSWIDTDWHLGNAKRAENKREFTSDCTIDWMLGYGSRSGVSHLSYWNFTGVFVNIHETSARAAVGMTIGVAFEFTTR